MKKTVNDLSEIAKLYGISEFIKVERGDELCILNGEDGYINHSYICGNYRIEIGIYNDNELMIASFFHELGHIVNSKNNRFNSEESAWKIGFQLAKKHGYDFSNKTYKWTKDQLKTYEKYINKGT